MKKLFLVIDDIFWTVKCNFQLWLHGPYGLARVIERMPYIFIIKYLRKYGAEIEEDCRIETGIILHRPQKNNPFSNLIMKRGSFIGHKSLIDLTDKVIFEKYSGVGGYCQIWTHQTNSLIPPCPENIGCVVLKENSICYSGVIVSPGITIGENARIGANSLVNKNVEPDTFMGGVPAKVLIKL